MKRQKRQIIRRPWNILRRIDLLYSCGDFILAKPIRSRRGGIGRQWLGL